MYVLHHITNLRAVPGAKSHHTGRQGGQLWQNPRGASMDHLQILQLIRVRILGGEHGSWLESLVRLVLVSLMFWKANIEISIEN